MIVRTVYGQAVALRPHSSILLPLLANSSPSSIVIPSRRSSYSRRSSPPKRKITSTTSSSNSSTAPSITIPNASATSTPFTAPADDINAPASTRPAPLAIPDPDPKASAVSNLVAKGKAYLTFYKTGLKNTWSNWRAIDSVRAAYSVRNTSPLSLFEAVVRPGSSFTRRDYQLLIRGTRDVRRLAPFGVVLFICGEFTPLLVPFLGAIVPKTCWIPAQVQRSREKWERRRLHSFHVLDGILEAAATREQAIAKSAAEAKERVGNETVEQTRLRKLNSPSPSAHPPPPPQSVQPAPIGGLHTQPLTLAEVSHMLVSLRVAPPWLISRFTAQALLARMRKRLQYLVLDDMLIERAGGVAGLNCEELQIAAEERGLNVLGVPEETLRRRLGAWVRHSRAAVDASFVDGYIRMGEMLVSRPDEWDAIGKQEVNRTWVDAQEEESD